MLFILSILRVLNLYVLTSTKKFSFDKVLHPQLLHTDSNKANIVGLQAWMNARNLLYVEATCRSSKSSHKQDHTGLFLPKTLQPDILQNKYIQSIYTDQNHIQSNLIISNLMRMRNNFEISKVIIIIYASTHTGTWTFNNTQENLLSWKFLKQCSIVMNSD